jgi:transcriptional regulator with XRE-family HTH domain
VPRHAYHLAMTASTVREAGQRGGPSDSELAESSAAEPVLGEILRRARTHCGFSLRQVEQRSGISNAHLSQIERGAIKRPDIALLMELADLYQLDYRLVAEWAGYLDPSAPRNTSSGLAGMALRLFVDLDPSKQHEALRYLEMLREQAQAHP